MGRFPSGQHKPTNFSWEMEMEVERLEEGLGGLGWRIELQSVGWGLWQGH